MKHITLHFVFNKIIMHDGDNWTLKTQSYTVFAGFSQEGVQSSTLEEEIQRKFTCYMSLS